MTPFEPPRCPHEDCEQHLAPRPGFYRPWGWYQPKCRKEPVPRFRCRYCRRSFSRQTFRHDYRDRRPECNAPLFLHLVSGVGLRQSARLVKLDVHSVQGKLRKIGRTCRRLQDNLCPRLPGERTFLLDEEETFETASIRTLTVPIAIERETWFVIATGVAPTRRRAAKGTARRRRQDREELEHGKREDKSRECVRGVLQSVARRLPEGSVRMLSDEKASYPVLARAIFGERLVHETTPSRRPRTVHNPLFPINTTIAMTRDNCGRLRRRSWLVSKRGADLQAQLHIFTAYRNFVRPRFNYDQPEDTPAKLLGLVPRQLAADEVLGWYQGWGARSIHPLSLDGSFTVADREAANAACA